jgi:hypothetical protein
MLLLISENFGVKPPLILLVTLTPRVGWVAGGERPFSFFLVRESTALHRREKGERIHLLLVSHIVSRPSVPSSEDYKSQ